MTGRGFTLLETALAMVIGAMVLVIASGLFVAMGNAERSFAMANERSSEMAVTQTAVRRAFMRLVMAPNSTAVREGQVDDRRPRVLLTEDPGAGAEGVPRFEVVVSRAPVGFGLASPAAAWAFSDEDRASLNFVNADGSGGQVRGVFELRRDNARERVMRSLGIASPMWDRADGTAAGEPGVRDEHGWTLWWRRMPADEIAALQNGRSPWGDGEGDREEEARRLAGSVRLARGLERARWQVFKSDTWTDVYGGTIVRDLPAYLKLTLRTVSGGYAEWLFEVEWTTSETIGSDTAANALLGLDANGDPVAGGTDTGSGDTSGGDTGDGTDGGGRDRPGGRPGSGDNGGGPTAGDGSFGDSSSGGRSQHINLGGGKGG